MPVRSVLVSRLPLNWPYLCDVVENTPLQIKAVKSNNQTCFGKNIATHFRKWQADKDSIIDSSIDQTLDVKMQLENYFSTTPENYVTEDYKEKERRIKIGLANRGRVPWNKGRKHSAETRKLIKERTIEALRDPKVREKMSECSHAHSEQSKQRIGYSLKRVWAKRLMRKRVKEKIFMSWLESIAVAARKGGCDQQELDWDSYNKLKDEIALQQLQWDDQKTKAKDIAKMRGQRAKPKKIKRKRENVEATVEARGQTRRKTSKKSKEDKEGLAFNQGLKLKARLTKIHRKKSINSQLRNQSETTASRNLSWEELDMDFIKREKMRREVSLADQIRDAKSKRMEATSVSSFLSSKMSSSSYRKPP